MVLDPKPVEGTPTDPNASKTTPPGAQPGQPAAGQPKPGEEGKPEDQKTVPLSALHEARETIKEMKLELDTVKEMQTTMLNQPPPGQQDPYQPYQQPAAPSPTMTPANVQLEELWKTDPRRAVQTEMVMALNWYDKVGSGVDDQLDKLAAKNEDVKNYRSDINKYLRSLPAQQRTQPGVVQAAYFYVKGQKTDDLISLSKEDLIKKIKSGEQVQGLTPGSSQPIEPAKTDKPTVEQANAAKAMGMSIEDYMKGVKVNV